MLDSPVLLSWLPLASYDGPPLTWLLPLLYAAE